jgi:hypothetical protein
MLEIDATLYTLNCRAAFLPSQTKSFRIRTVKTCVRHLNTPGYQEKKTFADMTSKKKS